MTSANDWAWWAGRDEEWMTVGPWPTKEDAVARFIDDYGVGEGDGVVLEAIMSDLRLDAHNTLEAWLDHWVDDTDLFSTEHDAPELRGTAEDLTAATADLQAALNGWQQRWAKILPTPNIFACTRNQETIHNTVDPDMLPGGHDNPRESA